MKSTDHSLSSCVLGGFHGIGQTPTRHFRRHKGPAGCKLTARCVSVDRTTAWRSHKHPHDRPGLKWSQDLRASYPHRGYH